MDAICLVTTFLFCRIRKVKGGGQNCWGKRIDQIEKQEQAAEGS